MRDSTLSSTYDGLVSSDALLRLRRTTLRLIGFILMFTAIAIALSLATWNAADPSLTHLTDVVPTNVFGYPGASLSDILIQSLGVGSIMVVVPMGVWAYRMLEGRAIYRWTRRVLLLLLSLMLFSVVLSSIPTGNDWALYSGYGGVIGDGILGAFQFVLAPILGDFGTWVVSVLSGVIALWTTLHATFPSSLARRPILAESASDDSDDLNWQDFEHPDTITARDRIRLEHWRIFGFLAHLWCRIKFRRQPSKSHEVVEFTGRPDLAKPSGFGVQALYGAFGARAVVQNWRESREREFARERMQASKHVNDRDLSLDRGGNHVYLAHPNEGPQLAPPRAGGDPADDRSFFPSQDFHSSRSDEEGDEPEPDHPAPALSDRGESVSKSGKQRGSRRRAGLRKAYLPPEMALLKEAVQPSSRAGCDQKKLAENARELEQVLQDFGVKGEIIDVRPGPVVTLYELEPAPGLKSSRVIGLADDIARSMSAVSARVAVVPGRNAIGIELPNQKRDIVLLREILQTQSENESDRLPLCLGKNIGGSAVVTDLSRMPHLLIAGTTGSGKSVAVNTMILSLLYRLSPEQCRLIMIDPKMLELSIYDGIPHLLTPVVTDPRKAVLALKWAVREMESRYKNMSKLGVRNIAGYNTRIQEAKQRGVPISRTVQTGFDRDTGEALFERENLELEPIPLIVVIVDEMADLMMVAGKDIESAVQRLAQMARAAGIHIIMATQRPSVDVITGTIKANFPTRISFQVTSRIDSRTILGESGAEQLLGQGDMLYMAGGGRISRVHGAFVSDQEVENIVQHLKSLGAPEYRGDVFDEVESSASPSGDKTGTGSGDLYDQAVEIVLRDKKASTSYVQRRLSIGYNRAATLIEKMEQEGVISSPNHAGRREIIEQENAIAS